LINQIDLKKAVVVTSWDKVTLIGLETNIHYTIIDLIEPKQGKRLFKLRNPFINQSSVFDKGKDLKQLP
jgi:hypothetical protein